MSTAQPQSPATEVVNSGIAMFAFVFPLQSPRVQESMLEQLSTHLSSSTAQKDPARKSAVAANVATALLLTVRVLHNQMSSPAGNLQSATAEKSLQSMLHVSRLHLSIIPSYSSMLTRALVLHC